MAGPNPLAGAVAAPCKLTMVTGDTFDVSVGDLPVSVVVASDPVNHKFTFLEIEVFDSTGARVDRASPNAVTAKLPPTLQTLAAGTYNVVMNISPSATAKPGQDPFDGGQARVFENCAGKTLLFIANANRNTPKFKVVVK
jgi:hypothetical protein